MVSIHIIRVTFWACFWASLSCWSMWYLKQIGIILYRENVLSNTVFWYSLLLQFCFNFTISGFLIDLFSYSMISYHSHMCIPLPGMFSAPSDMAGFSPCLHQGLESHMHADLSISCLLWLIRYCVNLEQDTEVFIYNIFSSGIRKQYTCEHNELG